ncbi:MAG: hypothetical protein KatS3mg092_0184 [Patescibacteria group bacterium]|nr:MAG: hypothetical protein KatS3mg092_0184 [Patescibacteria group bacterium]
MKINSLLAQVVELNGQKIQGPLVIKDSKGDIIQDIKLADIISRILQFMMPLAGVILLFVLIWGGYDYILSQGNQDKVKKAQEKITTGIIGFSLLILSYFIVKLISFIFGLQGGII